MMSRDIWLSVAVVVAVASYLLLWGYERKLSSYRQLRLPPGPSRGWPIVGHLPLLATSDLPHRTLIKLAKKYGPVMYLQLGLAPSIVVSSADMLREFFKVNDTIMASRPPFSAGEILGYNGENIVSQPYGDRWRDMRKLFMKELLSIKRLNELQAVRRREVFHALESIAYRAQQSADRSVNMNQELMEMTFNNTTKMLASKRYFGPELQPELLSHLMVEVTNLAGTFEVGDFIPFLKRFDLQGNIKRMRNLNAAFDRLLENILLEHKMGADHRASGVKDFIDIMVELQQTEHLPDTRIKGFIIDFLVAATETSSTVLEWLMADLQQNPQSMTRIQEELDKVVGKNRIVDESDLPNLTYFQACVKESMRLHPTVPLMLPHESSASCTIGGYFIPAKARVIVNMAAIHWNPETYHEPEKFCPERFLASGPQSHVEMKGQHFDLVPFGTGRRICVGMNLGLLMVHLGGAVLLQAYDWELPAGITRESLDMSEAFGAACRKKVALHLVPTPRLPANVYAAEAIEISH